MVSMMEATTAFIRQTIAVHHLGMAAAAVVTAVEAVASNEKSPIYRAFFCLENMQLKLRRKN
jgi:hypothetical protein